MQNIDKITYALVGVVFLVALGYTFVAEDPGARLVNEIETADAQIRETADAQSSELRARKVEDVARKVADQYRGLSADADFPSWSFYRRPGEVRLTEPRIVVEPTHEGPRLRKIRQVRDKERKRPVIVVEGEAPRVEHASIEELWVEVRETEGEWVKGPRVERNGSELEVTLAEEVEPGATYEVRFGTRAKSLSERDFEPGAKVRYSQAFEVRLPVDQSWEVVFVVPPTYDGLEPIPGRVTLVRRYYDYDGDKIEKERGELQEPKRKVDFPSPNQTQFPGTDWYLWEIRMDVTNPSTGKKDIQVEFRDAEGDKKLRLFKNDVNASLTEEDVEGESSREEAAPEAGEEAAGDTGTTVEPEKKDEEKKVDDWGDDDF